MTPAAALRRDGRGGRAPQSLEAAVSSDEPPRITARLGLLEGLICLTGAVDCARFALQWLAETLEVSQSICLLRSADGAVLVSMASYGILGAAVNGFTLSLNDRKSPLASALVDRHPAFVPPVRAARDRVGRPLTPFGDRAFHVVPLSVADETVGLLLIGGDALPVGLPWFTALLARKLAETVRVQELEGRARAERDRLTLIIDSVADPIVVTDAAGAVTLINEPAERLFTAPAAGAPGPRWAQANDARFSSFIVGMLASADRCRVGEIGLVDPKTGEPMPVEAIAGRVVSGQGELTAVVTILHDRREAIERAALCEQLQQASKELEGKVQAATADILRQNELLRRQAVELEQASALKSQFLANMSHEFRTPLNAMLGYTSMLLEGVAGPPAPALRRQLGRIASNGRHLRTIINEILDFSRLEANRMPLQLSRFEIPELVEEVRSELEPIILRSTLTVAVQMAEDLPVVTSDRQKVKQILRNLLGNALKFTHEGSVTIGARPDGNGRTISLAVSDTGIGVAEADQEKIFEDFRQLDGSPTRAYGGTGLGLSICRRLAQMLEGRVCLHSQPGHGSTFTLTLPIEGPR